MPGGPSIASSRPPPRVLAIRLVTACQFGVALEQAELHRQWLLGHPRAAPFVTGVHRVRLLPDVIPDCDGTGLTMSHQSPPRRLSSGGVGKHCGSDVGAPTTRPPCSPQHDGSMVITDDEVETARLTGRRLRQKSNPTESEVHVMSTKPSGIHPPTEDANDERGEAR